MLSINNLSIHFSGNYLFEDISFTLERNSRAGLVGRNGTGKTTLLRIITGLETPESGTITKSNDYKIGYLPQEGLLDSQKNVYEEVKSSLIEIYHLEKKISKMTNELSLRNDFSSNSYAELLNSYTDLNERFRILGGNSLDSEIEKVLTGLGFEREEFYRSVNEFSGGWKMRVELAKILLNKPDCILLDEPTNHLDIESIQWLQDFLKSYFGAVIIVSHDRNFLNNATNRTIEIANKQIYDFPVAYSDYVVLREEQKKQQLNAFKNQQKQIEETEKFIDRFRYKATLATRVQSRIKQLEKIDRIELEEEDTSAIKLKFPEPPRSGRVVADISHLNKSYGSKTVLEDISFAIERGEKVAFVGKNGEGKSTLSRILAGLESFDGKMELGFNVMSGYYAQHQAELLDMNNTVFEVIDNAAIGDMRMHIRSLLGAFLFSGDSVYKKVKVLSGGEKSRLALAKMLLEPVNFIILDEPTNHLDMAAKDVLKNALISYEGALIIVSHDIDFLDGLTTKTVYFGNKKLKEYLGNIRDFLREHNLENLKVLEKNLSKTSQQAEPEIKAGKIQRLQQKEFQREENKYKKQISQIETEISGLEGKIGEIENSFLDTTLYSEPEKLKTLRLEYDELRKALEQKMEQWEALNNDLEDFRNFSIIS